MRLAGLGLQCNATAPLNFPLFEDCSFVFSSFLVICFMGGGNAVYSYMLS